MNLRLAYKLLEIPRDIKPTNAFLKEQYLRLIDQASTHEQTNGSVGFVNSFQLIETKKAYEFLLRIEYHQRPILVKRPKGPVEQPETTDTPPKERNYNWLFLLLLPGGFVGLLVFAILFSLGSILHHDIIENVVDKENDPLLFKILRGIFYSIGAIPVVIGFALLGYLAYEKISAIHHPATDFVLLIVLLQNIILYVAFGKQWLSLRSKHKKPQKPHSN